MIKELTQTPWKIYLELHRLLSLPYIRLYFMLNGLVWGEKWKIYGRPIIQKHRGSTLEIGSGFIARSLPASNPLAPDRPVVISTRFKNAALHIGSDVGITGGTICASERIEIGNRVWIGANCIIVDTDFHPLDPIDRQQTPLDGNKAPIIIEDDVFIGMNSIILKGVHIGEGSVVGAGSIVAQNVPAGVVVAGNPAHLIRNL